MKRILVLLSLLSLITSCKEYVTKKDIIRVSDYQASFMAPIYIADKLGYYKDEGLILEFFPYNSCPTALIEISQNRLDIAISMDFPLTKCLINELDIELISYFAHSNQLEEHIIRSDIKLEDSITGVTMGTNSEHALDIYLRSNGILSSDITIINLQPYQMENALINGDINSLVTVKPFTREISDNVTNVISTPLLSNIDIICISVSKNYSKNKPDNVSKFLKATNRGITYLYNNIEESLNLLETDNNLYKDILEVYHFRLGLDNHLLQTIKNQWNWLANDPPKSLFEKINTDYLRSIESKFLTLEE